jgi:hypothetical protein
MPAAQVLDDYQLAIAHQPGVPARDGRRIDKDVGFWRPADEVLPRIESER